MPTTRCPWAVAFFSSSLLLWAASGASAQDSKKTPLAESEVIALELEAKLASTPDLYVVIHLSEKTFTVKSRGVELGTVPLQAAEFLAHEHSGAKTVEPIEVPGLWTIAGRAPAGERRVLLPRELRPYSEDDEGAAPVPAPKPGERLHKAPSEYSVRLENGWWLEISQEPPTPSSSVDRFKERVGEGWNALLGGRVDEPNLFSLRLPAEGAQSIHHIFRPGRMILVLR